MSVQSSYSAAPAVDVAGAIDRSGFGTRQIVIIVLCGLLMMLDGYDSGEVSFVGPSLMHDWQLTPKILATLFTVNGIAQIIAALIMGPVADRYGRRWIMIGGTAFTGVMSIASAYSGGINEFLLWRILCSLGLAGVMTNAIALGAEYAPLRWRSFAVIALYCGFAVGQSIGAETSAQLIPTHGWRIILVIGGVLPLVVSAFCAFGLPESIRFLALRKPQSPVIPRELRRINPALPISPDTTFVNSEPPATKRPIRELFIEGRAPLTLLVWLVFTANITGIFFLIPWVPTLLHSSNLPLDQSLRVASVMQIGTIISALIIAVCMDRWGAARVLIPVHLLGVFGVAVFGQTVGAGWIMYVMAAIMGAGVLGAQTDVIGFTAGLYPTAIRATGVGSAFGIGRLGTIIGPIYGGFVLSMGLPASKAFLFGAVPPAIASVAIIGLWLITRSARSDQTLSVETVRAP